MLQQTKILSDEQKTKIHQQSLKVLNEVGVKFLSKKALTLLKKNGAVVDFNNHIAKIPEEMVIQALKTAPSSFVLGARNPEFDFSMPSKYTAYTLDGAATFAQDFKTGQRRMAVTQDLRDSLRVFEEMRLGMVTWPNVMLSDVPVYSGEIRTIIESFKYSSKHIQNELHHVHEIPYLIDILAAITGSEQAIRDRKIYSVCYCTIPPLTHDADMCETYMELCEFEVPILTFPMPACGSTGPASLYYNVAVANAEGLSSLVLFQMAKPGTPVIFGNALGTTNFANGAFLEGAAEMTLQVGAMGEMAHYYNLPNTQAGCLTDSKAPDAQATLEKMLTTLPLVLNGTDVINGIGEVETSQLLVLEQIIVDHEIACICERIKQGVDTSDNKDLFSDVEAAKPGGQFLTSMNTLKMCRSDEYFVPSLADRTPFEKWMELGKPDIYSRARKKVEEILENPLKNPLPDSVLGKLERIQEQAERDLKKKAS
jgi:trimethylamine---corrinoid protein Co-methyltransferase